MSNLIFKTKKVKGKGTVYLTPCPYQDPEHPEVQKRVGNPKCCNRSCPRYGGPTYTAKGVGVNCKDVL